MKWEETKSSNKDVLEGAYGFQVTLLTPWHWRMRHPEHSYTFDWYPTTGTLMRFNTSKYRFVNTNKRFLCPEELADYIIKTEHNK